MKEYILVVLWIVWECVIIYTRWPPKKCGSSGNACAHGQTLPPIGGEFMGIQEIIQAVPDSKKISIADPDSAIEMIVDAVINSGLLWFDGRTPVIKYPLYYKRLTESEAEALVAGFLDERSQIIVPTRHIKEALNRLHNIVRLQINLEAEFWKGQMYVNTLTGLYSISEQKVIPFNDNFKFDYLINVRYIPNTKLDDAPAFKRYVESSLGLDQLKCLLRILGYCLSSLTKGRKCFIILGKPKSGKSTILNLLERVLSIGLISHEPFDKMSTERAKAHYIGMRMNISREISIKPNKNGESFKSLVSCEFTTGEEKFEVQKNFIPTLSFIFAGNVDISFSADSMDDAILDRLVYIIYDKEISSECIDLNLEDKLYGEKDKIFSLALDELKGLIADNYNFCMGAVAEEHLKHRRYLIHSAESFLDEKCKISDGGKVSTVKLYDEYARFCKANALNPVGRNTFYDKVRNYNASITNGRVPDSDGNSVQGFHGISLIGGERQSTDAESDE